LRPKVLVLILAALKIELKQRRNLRLAQVLEVLEPYRR
jgi:hypothetical protein